MKILLVIFALVVAVIAAGLHFHFNAILPIFAILGFGLFWVTRDPGPPPLKGGYVPWGHGLGVYLRGRDHVQDEDPAAGEDSREGDGFR